MTPTIEGKPPCNSHQEKFPILFVGALGIVFGDIGTSPLYALKGCFAISGIPVVQETVFGLVSLFIWTLFLVVWLKYALLVMRVDNNGEGGILALTALCQKLKLFKNKNLVIGLSILGTALFFGDGIITPAISVLSAVEGLELITKDFTPYIIPISLVILTCLFAIQRKGSGYIGRFFGPIMVVWFVFIGLIGLYQIFQHPNVLWALSPHHAIVFLIDYKIAGLMTLGGVVLVVTGGEALYADMGHFGRGPIRASWGSIVFPALVLNYLGQGALLVDHPELLKNCFFSLVPSWALYPSIILATIATVIASQSILSGIFTITEQSILMNYVPRMKVDHTSSKQIGQIYIGSINGILFVLTVTATLMFKSSDNMANAYGLSVSGVMLMTSILITLVAHKAWKWPLWKLICLCGPMICLDMLFLGTNMMKIIEGAWYAILVTSIICYIVSVWMKGNKALESQKQIVDTKLSHFIKKHEKKYKERIPGTAIFLSRVTGKTPNSLLIQLHHNKFFHENMIFLTFTIMHSPFVTPKERFIFEKIDEHSFSVEARFGFKETPNISRVILALKDNAIIKDPETVSIFLSRGVPIASKSKALNGFSEQLYIFLASIAQNASDFYKIPYHKVIELGIRYKI